MARLENIEAIEKELWRAADTLRANSNYASNEYFLPVIGLIFLRHAYSRYLKVRDEVVAALPTRGGKTRELTKDDFFQKSAIFLRPEARFDHLVALPSGANRANAIVGAMESIEADYQNLKGQLPKEEYQQLDDEVLGQLLRTLNPEELKKASGDIFGRIYEYFLTQFADQKAHDGGEFFTPVSLVSLIAIYASTGVNGWHGEAKVKGPGVVTGRSGSLGTVLYVPTDFWPLNTTLWVKEFRRVGPLYALHLLQGLCLAQYNGGAAVPPLNRNDVHRIDVLSPPRLLRDQFEDLASPIYRQIRTLSEQAAKLRQARDLLLPRLMNGEIAV